MHPLADPWAISESGFQLVLGIWSRGELFPDAVLKARADRGEDKPLCNDANVMMVDGGVAIIPIRGPLMRHAAMFSDISGARSYASIRRDLATALADPAVRGILLLVDSPGGEAAGVGELADQIRAAAARKPVVAYVDGAGCSAAYWLSSAAQEIVCAPSAILGSIGTRIALVDASRMGEKTGIQPVEIVSSQSPGKRSQPVDDDVLGRAQQIADDLTDLFLGAVARFRGTTPDAVAKQYGSGDVLVGEKAVTAGLADRLGTFDTALATLRGRMPSLSPSGALAARTGAPSMKNDDVQDMVPSSEHQALQARLTAAEQKLAEVKPLLDQVAELTEKTTVAEQQVALAQIGVRAAMAGAVGDVRAELMAQAKQKGIPPVAMKGWDKLPIETLRQVVDATEGLQQKKPGGPAQQSEPAAKKVVLTDEIRAEYRLLGVTDEATMIKREELRLGITQPTGPASGAPGTDEDEE